MEKETDWQACSAQSSCQAHVVLSSCHQKFQTSIYGGCDVNISCLSWSRLDMKINKAEFAS